MAYTPEDLQKVIKDELFRARQKHPHWPTDNLHRAAIISGQAGGIAIEALKTRETGQVAHLEKEVLHTLITCMRSLLGD